MGWGAFGGARLPISLCNFSLPGAVEAAVGGGAKNQAAMSKHGGREKMLFAARRGDVIATIIRNRLSPQHTLSPSVRGPSLD